MRKLFGFGLAAVMNVILIGTFAWYASHPLPEGDVRITDMNGAVQIVVASR